MNARAGDAERLLDEAALLLAAADVLDHGVREDDVELAVRERQVEGVALDVARARVALPEPRPFVQAERRDPLRPGVELLEEVERPATAPLLAEGGVVDSDVQHRGLRGRRHRLHEERELAPPRTQRDGVGEAHLEGTVRCEPVIEDVVRPGGPYRLHLMTYGRPFETPLPGGGRGQAWQRSDGHVAAAGTGRGAARAAALRARPRRRHDRVRPPLPPRPAARPVAPAPARPAAAADADGGAGAPPRGLRPADRGEARSRESSWRSFAPAASPRRRGSRSAHCRRRSSAGSAWRPAAPRRSSASAARSISRACAPSRSRRSRRGSSASAASGRGRSGSSRSKGSAAGATGSSAISASSSCARPFAAAGSSCTRPRNCWSRTASGPGSRART